MIKVKDAFKQASFFFFGVNPVTESRITNTFYEAASIAGLTISLISVRYTRRKRMAMQGEEEARSLSARFYLNGLVQSY